MELTGTIEKIYDTKSVSDKFKTREFVIKTIEDKYPQTILIQMTQDKCAKLDNYNVGETVKCHINIRGRMWTSKTGEEKCFNTIEAWKLETIEGISSAPSDSAEPPTIQSGDSDNLPF